MKTRKLTYSALLIAICIATGNVIYIPVGTAKCFPVQHIVNVIAAVILGPWYAVAIAFCVSLMRNLMGTGTLLAFPGSMIGAFLAAIVFRYTHKPSLAVVGEIFGTGIIGGLAAYPIAAFIMGKETALFFYIVPFLLSTVVGSIIAYALLTALRRMKVLDLHAGMNAAANTDKTDKIDKIDTSSKD